MQNRPRPRAVILLAALAAAWTMAFPGVSAALEAKSMARLKQAGVSDETLAVMIAERSVETAAFSVEDILALKAAGIGEKALQTLIREGSFLKDREPVVYGNDLRPLSTATASDLIRLKQAGMSDDVLQAVVRAGRREGGDDRREALRLLRDMGIWVDLRD